MEGVGGGGGYTHCSDTIMYVLIECVKINEKGCGAGQGETKLER